MVYQWKLPGVMPVDAQVAGNELERVYQKYGNIEPTTVVDESRPASAPLHSCFEWDDAVAAERYRESQACQIIRSIVTVCEDAQTPVTTRAFVNVSDGYTPISVVVNTPNQLEVLLSAAFKELAAFKRKYSTLNQLRPVLDAIDLLTSEEVGA